MMQIIGVSMLLLRCCKAVGLMRTPPLRWQFQMQNVMNYASQTSPASSNGIVYAATGDNNVPIGWVYALNGSSGELLWSFKTSSVTKCPAVSEGRVFAVSDYPLGGTLYAIDAVTGTELWHKNGSSIQDMSIWCPTAIGDLVYLRTSLKSHQFSAFNASSGALSWVYEPKGYTGILDALSPVILTDAALCGSFYDSVWCVDRKNGMERWRRNIGSASYGISNVAVQDGRIFFTVDGNQTQAPGAPFPTYHRWLYALDEVTGADLWPRFDVGGSGDPSTPSAAEGMVWAAGYPSDYFGFDARSGRKLWGGEKYSFRVTSPHGKPLWSANILYVANSNYLTALNATSGAKLWNYDTGADTGFSSPALCGSAIVIINNKGKVLAVDAGTDTHSSQPSEPANAVFV